jgi:hypothetical protein
MSNTGVASDAQPSGITAGSQNLQAAAQGRATGPVDLGAPAALVPASGQPLPGLPGIPDNLQGVSKDLVAIVYAEATAQNFEAKLAVANVANNRYEDATHEFRRVPTIEDVIRQPGQFAAVNSDRFELAQRALSGTAASLTPTQATLLTAAFFAARAVWVGSVPDTTQGALYFYSPIIQQPRYITEGLAAGTLKQVYPGGVRQSDFLFFAPTR